MLKLHEVATLTGLCFGLSSCAFRNGETEISSAFPEEPSITRPFHASATAHPKDVKSMHFGESFSVDPSKIPLDQKTIKGIWIGAQALKEYTNYWRIIKDIGPEQYAFKSKNKFNGIDFIFGNSSSTSNSDSEHACYSYDSNGTLKHISFRLWKPFNAKLLTLAACLDHVNDKFSPGDAKERLSLIDRGGWQEEKLEVIK